MILAILSHSIGRDTKKKSATQLCKVFGEASIPIGSTQIDHTQHHGKCSSSQRNLIGGTEDMGLLHTPAETCCYGMMWPRDS